MDGKFFIDDGIINGGRYCAQCKYKCCQTDGDNFIVLFPWERDAAHAAGMNTDHLTRFGDNPLFAHCTRPCNGANDYKPINCATYPLYPVNIDLTEWVRGAPARCPISDARLRRQIPIIADGLRRMERNHPGSIKTLVDFIRTYPGALGPLDKDKNGK